MIVEDDEDVFGIFSTTECVKDKDLAMTDHTINWCVSVKLAT